jgi:hypothetical protein
MELPLLFCFHAPLSLGWCGPLQLAPADLVDCAHPLVGVVPMFHRTHDLCPENHHANA